MATTLHVPKWATEHEGTLRQWVEVFTDKGYAPTTGDVDPLGGGVVWWHLYWSLGEGPFIVRFSNPYAWGKPSRGQRNIDLALDNDDWLDLPIEQIDNAIAQLEAAKTLVPKLREIMERHV